MTGWLYPTLAFLLALAGGPSAAQAQDPQAQDAQAVAAGHALALKVCAACHVVGPDQATPPQMNPPAPNFVEVAGRPNVTGPFLRDFLAKPHGGTRALSAMPGFLIPGPEADAVIAYLLSLKAKP